MALMNVKMRASRRSGKTDVHISGAEGIYEETDVDRAVRAYLSRALGHPKGRPDRVIIKVEEIRGTPKSIGALPLCTLGCKSASTAVASARSLLFKEGIPQGVIDRAFRILGRGYMRGAALMDMKNGTRLDTDRERGVRVSAIGISKGAERSLSRRLSRLGLNTNIVKEALVLASKVASCPGVAAEICVSDNPDYTTGYVATKSLGYVRVPNIKPKGSRWGGRVFFMRDDDSGRIKYLERTPVIVTAISRCYGVVGLDEILRRPDM